jgi:RNA polymerase sigma factor (sigma-70 family)
MAITREWSTRGVLSKDTDSCRDNVNTAFEVFAEHSNFIRAVIGSRIKNQAQADDIFQNFFLSLVHKPVPEGVKDVKSYLYKAIINDIIDAARKVERYQALVHRYSEQLSFSINTISPENAFNIKEETDKVFELIKGRLRKSELRAVTLRYCNSMDTNEVAARMGVKNGTVRRYISVGLAKVRKFLTVESRK